MTPHGHVRTPPLLRGSVCVIVNGLPGSGKSTLARAIAADLDLPLFSKDAVKDFVASACPREPTSEELSAMGHDVLWALVRACPDGAVIKTWFGPTGRDKIQQELIDAGIEAGGRDRGMVGRTRPSPSGPRSSARRADRP